jgi:tetratricopeptide (TPR) repeat protein
VEKISNEVKVETQASAEGKAGVPGWLSVRLLARLTAMALGSVERRKEIRLRLQNRSSELIDRINELLDDARRVLSEAGRAANLLVVVDNLDRLEPEAIEPLFFRNGDFLKKPRAHVIYTIPIATVVAPNRISMVFEQNFTFPMVKVRSHAGNRFSRGIDALARLMEHRAEINAVFKSVAVGRDLAELSGGSVRDLMRLVQYASRAALADDKSQIDKPSVTDAARSLQQEFERMLIPGGVYYPLLARVHLTKQDAFSTVEEADPAKVEAYRKYRLGQLPRAISCYEQNLAIARRIGDRLPEGVALSNLGAALSRLGSIDQAIKSFEDSLTIAEEIQEPTLIEFASSRLAEMGGEAIAEGQITT